MLAMTCDIMSTLHLGTDRGFAGFPARPSRLHLPDQAFRWPEMLSAVRGDARSCRPEQHQGSRAGQPIRNKQPHRHGGENGTVLRNRVEGMRWGPRAMGVCPENHQVLEP